jgi:hypothetical protein
MSQTMINRVKPDGTEHAVHATGQVVWRNNKSKHIALLRGFISVLFFPSALRT